MRRLRNLWLILLILLLGQLSFAGDVVYTMWEDDGGQLWVRIQNDTDRSIRVESIFIVFYNAQGKPIDQKNFPCNGNCRLSSRDTRDFGPYAPPPNTESSRVQRVKYAVE